MYGKPGTFESIQKNTAKGRQNDKDEESEVKTYEEGIVYLPRQSATYQEAKEYTIQIKKEELMNAIS